MGTSNTYSDTLTQARSVVDVLDFCSPEEFPFLKAVTGGTEKEPSLNNTSAEVKATKHEWIEVTDPAWNTTLAAAIVGAGDSSITIAAGYVANVTEGMILLIESEQLLVGTTNGANPVPVTRGFAGTTAAAHANSTAVTIIGRAHKEGAIAPQDRKIYPLMPFNYVQEFAAKVSLSELEQAIERFGIDNAIEYDSDEKTRSLLHAMERAFFWQTKQAPASNAVGAFGGLLDYVPAGNTVDASSGALTTDMVHNVLQNIFNTAGASKMPNLMVCNAYVRRKLSKIFATTNVTTFREQNDMRGGVKVERFMTDFGELAVLLCGNVNPTDLWIVKTDAIGMGPMRGKELTRVPLAKTGTSDEWMISGSYTAEIRKSTSHGRVKNISLVA